MKRGKYVGVSDVGSGKVGWSPQSEQFAVVIRDAKAILQSKANGKFLAPDADDRLFATADSADAAAAFTVTRAPGGSYCISIPTSTHSSPITTFHTVSPYQLP